MKIIDVVKFNYHHAYVFNEIPKLTYEKNGSLLIGSDDSQTFYDCLFYERLYGNMKAFAGREFDLPMKDGTIIHCNGQYWNGRIGECSKAKGINLIDITAATKNELLKYYVFFGRYIDRDKLDVMIEEFNKENPDYKVWEYYDYEKHIKNKQ